MRANDWLPTKQWHWAFIFGLWWLAASIGQLLPPYLPFIVRQAVAVGIGIYSLHMLYRSLPNDTPMLFSESRVPNYLVVAGRWLLGTWEEKGRWGWVRYIALLMAIAVLQYGFLLDNTSPQVFGLDTAAFHYYLELHTQAALAASDLPFWNPYMFSGTPHLANMQVAPFYPPHVLLRIFFPPHAVLNTSIFAHILLSGLGMYGLACDYGLARPVAFLVGLGYLTSGGLALRGMAGHTNLLYAAAWLPVGWMLLRHVLRGRVLAAFGLSGVTALLLMVGHPTWAFYTLLWWSVYTVGWWWFGDAPRPAQAVSSALILGAVGLGIALAGVQLLPVITWASEVGLRSGYSADVASEFAISDLSFLMTWLVPGTQNWRSMAGGSGFYEEWLVVISPVLYLAAIGLLFQAPVGIISQREKRWWGLALLVTLVVSLGSNGVLYPVLYELAPPFRIIRGPGRMMLWWLVLLPLLGGLFLQSYSISQISKRTENAILALGLGGMVFSVGMAARHLLSGVEGLAIETLPLFWQSVAAMGMSALMVVSTVLVGISWRRSGRSGWLALGLLLCGVWGFYAAVVIAAPNRFLVGGAVITVMAGFLMALALGWLVNENTRPAGGLLLALAVAMTGFVFALPRSMFAVPPPQATTSDLTPRVLDWRQNRLVASQRANVSGYDTTMLGGYEGFWQSLIAQDPLSQKSLNALRFLGVDTIITQSPIVSSGLVLRHTARGRWMYGLDEALPRAVWVTDVRVAGSSDEALALIVADDFHFGESVVLEGVVPAIQPSENDAQVTIEMGNPYQGALRVVVNAPSMGVLVLSEPYYSERRISIDGVQAEVLRANVGFMAVVVPAGEHSVEVWYDPVSLRQGTLVSVLAIVVWLGLLIAAVRGRYGTYAIGVVEAGRDGAVDEE